MREKVEKRSEKSVARRKSKVGVVHGAEDLSMTTGTNSMKRLQSKNGSHSNFQSRMLKKRGTEQNEQGPPSGLGHVSAVSEMDRKDTKRSDFVNYIQDTLTKP